MDNSLFRVVAGFGIILIIARAGITAPIRSLILLILDKLILFLERWKNNPIVADIISRYVFSRSQNFCMMCCGFWVGIGMGLFTSVTGSIILDGCFFLAVGWLASCLEAATTRLEL